MKNRRKYLLAVLALSLGLTVLGSGCGRDKTIQETESETETKMTETESETESETETEPEVNVAYTSLDKSIRIVLPDSTWKVTQDADEMRVFSSGAAMISIVHAANESQMKNIASVAKSEEELKANLSKQYPDANSFEIQSFEKQNTNLLETYEYVVKYNETSMWTYAVTYGIIADNEAYVVSGTVTDDNKTLLAAVVKSVESFTVLNNSTFSITAGGQAETNAQSESQKQSESNSSAQEELDSLNDYGTSSTLYASDNVNIRQEPSTDSAILGSLVPGDQVTVVGETSQWFKVNINGNIGYISKAFLVSTPVTKSTEAEDSAAEEEEGQAANSGDVSDSTKIGAEYNSQIDYGTSYTYYATSEVNLRSEPGTDAAVMDSLGSGTAVEVIGETDNWFVVSVNGTKGYISKSYVSSQAPSSTGSDGSSTGGETTPDDSGTSGESGSTGSSGSVPSAVSGTITSAGVDTIVIAGDDGNTYTINTADASVNAEEGIYVGLYISAAIDSSTTPGGSLKATSVTGY